MHPLREVRVEQEVVHVLLGSGELKLSREHRDEQRHATGAREARADGHRAPARRRRHDVAEPARANGKLLLQMVRRHLHKRL